MDTSSLERRRRLVEREERRYRNIKSIGLWNGSLVAVTGVLFAIGALLTGDGGVAIGRRLLVALGGLAAGMVGCWVAFDAYMMTPFRWVKTRMEGEEDWMVNEFLHRVDKLASPGGRKRDDSWFE